MTTVENKHTVTTYECGETGEFFVSVHGPLSDEFDSFSSIDAQEATDEAESFRNELIDTFGVDAKTIVMETL